MQSPLRHGRAALGTTLAGGALAALSQAPERASRLLRHRYPTVAVTGKSDQLPSSSRCTWRIAPSPDW